MKAVTNFVKGISKAINSIVDFFENIIDFVISFIEDTVYVIKLTAEFVAEIPNYFSWLPAEALVLVVSIFAVVVIYKVLGREG